MKTLHTKFLKKQLKLHIYSIYVIFLKKKNLIFGMTNQKLENNINNNKPTAFDRYINQK